MPMLLLHKVRETNPVAAPGAFIPPEMSQQDMLSHLLGTSSSSAAVGGNLTAESNMNYQQAPAPQHPPQQQQPQMMQAPSSSSSSSGSSGLFVAAGPSPSTGAAAAAGAVPTTSSRIFSSSSTSRGTAAGAVGVQLGAGPTPPPSVGAAGKMKDHFSGTAAVGGAVSSGPSTHSHQAHGIVVDGELHQQRQTVPQPAPFSPLPTVGPGKASTKQGKWKQAVKIDR